MIFALLGCYRRFGTTYRCHFQGSSSQFFPGPVMPDVSKHCSSFILTVTQCKKSIPLDCLSPEAEGTTILRNVANCRPNGTEYRCENLKSRTTNTAVLSAAPYLLKQERSQNISWKTRKRRLGDLHVHRSVILTEIE